MQQQTISHACVEHRHHDRMGLPTVTGHQADVGDKALVQDGFDCLPVGYAAFGNPADLCPTAG